MPISVLISPVLFISAGKWLEIGDTTKGSVLLLVGLVLMIVGVFECNLKEKK